MPDKNGNFTEGEKTYLKYSVINGGLVIGGAISAVYGMAFAGHGLDALAYILGGGVAIYAGNELQKVNYNKNIKS